MRRAALAQRRLSSLTASSSSSSSYSSRWSLFFRHLSAVPEQLHAQKLTIDKNFLDGANVSSFHSSLDEFAHVY
jgi:hypothetical protein